MFVVSHGEVQRRLPEERERARSRALATESRRALLTALQQSGRPLGAGEAAAAVGLHRNTARVHLEVLCSLGVVSRHLEERSGRGRPRVLYEVPEAASVGAPASPLTLDPLAPLLAQQLMALVGASAMAERVRGSRLASPTGGGAGSRPPLSAEEALALVAEVLEELGLDPHAEPESARIHLHRCPFAGLAPDDRATARGVHLGMLRAIVEHLDVPLDVAGLELLVTDDPCLCTAQFRPSSRVAPPGRTKGPGRPRGTVEGGATVNS